MATYKTTDISLPRMDCFSGTDLKIEAALCERNGGLVWGQLEIMLTYVSGSGRHGSPPLSHKLVGVKTNLNDVVEQSQEWSQWEGRHENGGEAKLENCNKVRTYNQTRHIEQ